MKYLGIDYGERNIGIALSDEEGEMAFPYETLLNTSALAEDITKIVKNNDVHTIVLGESLDFNGEENPIMKRIHPFKKKLEEATLISVHFENELFSSKASERIHHRQISGQEKLMSKNDAGAATIILQSYLDKINKKDYGEN